MKPALFAVVACAALAAAPPPYRPDPSAWRLEVAPGLGGWMDASVVTLRLKVVDPNDPEPPREGAAAWDDAPDEDDPMDEGGAAETEVQRRARWEARERAWEARRARNAWRDRTVILWFNGEERRRFIRVGYPLEERLTCLGGENRLEILEPASGQRLVRTWWAASGRARLVVQQAADGDSPGGTLEVVEPGGALAASYRRTASGGMAEWNRYTHPHPPAGTYTLRWTGVWRGGKPGLITVEAVLDAGTERERRWSFRKLLLPGAGPVVLGTVDVEE